MSPPSTPRTRRSCRPTARRSRAAPPSSSSSPPSLQGIAKVQLDTVEVEGHGDTAHELEALTFFDANGAKIDEGKAIVIWKKVGEDWKLHRDMFSSNLPPPAPAPDADTGAPAEAGESAEDAQEAPAKTP